MSSTTPDHDPTTIGTCTSCDAAVPSDALWRFRFGYQWYEEDEDMSEWWYGVRTEDKVHAVCRGCAVEYGECYRCGVVRANGKFYSLSLAQLVELYGDNIPGPGDIPEVQCGNLNCEDSTCDPFAFTL
jgi:hypothetical protein